MYFLNININKKAVKTSHSIRNRAVKNTYNKKIGRISYIDTIKGDLKELDYSKKLTQFN